jgi:glutaredoxin
MICMSGSAVCTGRSRCSEWSATRMITITLYSKAGCHLCDQARDYLEELAADQDIDIQEIDIRRDPDLFERYRYRIPVILVDGVERLEGRIEHDDIYALLPPPPSA